MSPVPEVGQPEVADKGEASSGSDDGVTLQDFVVVPSQVSPSGSTSESHENEDLECYSDAQLKALLDEAITYKTPKEVEKTTTTTAEENVVEECAEPAEKQEVKKMPESEEPAEPPKEKIEVEDKPKDKNPFISMPSSWGPSFRTIDPNSFAGPKEYNFCPRPAHTFGTPGMCCYTPTTIPREHVPEVAKVRKERNAIIRNSHEIDGYRGSDNIDSLVKFIESSDSEPDHKNRGKGKPQKNGGSKKTKKAPPKPKAAPKVKEVPVEKKTTVAAVEKPLPERLPELPDELSGKASPTIDGSEFRVVMKKKKKPKN